MPFFSPSRRSFFLIEDIEISFISLNILSFFLSFEDVEIRTNGSVVEPVMAALAGATLGGDYVLHRLGAVTQDAFREE